MRINLEGGRLDNVQLGKGMTHLPLIQTLGATFTVTVNMPQALFLDPGGAGRTVLLPTEATSRGLYFVIINTADAAENLAVKEDSDTTTIATIGQGDIGTFYCDGVTWYAESVDIASVTTITGTTATFTSINAGSSGTAGDIDVFPGTASKGKLRIDITDQDADTTVTLRAAAMAQASVVSIPDPGAATANFLLTSAANDQVVVGATAAEIDRVADTSARLVAAGATLTVTQALHDGKTIALDTLAGSVCTLPAATGTGMRLRFVVSAAPTSNFHSIACVGTDEMSGVIFQVDTDSADALVAYPAIAADNYDTIQLNGTTKGGLIGDTIVLEDVVSGTWALIGFTNGNGTVTSPLSSAV